LRETLLGLRKQSLAAGLWETLLVDNASTAFPSVGDYSESAPENLRLMTEARLGLTSARLAGIRAARGKTIVLVDDDNVLDPGYLAEVVRLFSRDAHLGAAGGKSRPAFESPPARWHSEFFPLLALRDLGDSELIATSFRPEGAERNEYPAFAPIGAGMAIRREAALAWAAAAEGDQKKRRLDRSGLELVSGGDNDIVMTLLERGWTVGYFPTLSLRHLIPAGRLDTGYLSRLNRAIQRSWVQVLELHGANPWGPIPRWTVPLRKAKAFVRMGAWRSPSNRIRWQGACGHHEGRAAISR
jgi:glycosyltransferase involved in cell wall biosynthesis